MIAIAIIFLGTLMIMNVIYIRENGKNKEQ